MPGVVNGIGTWYYGKRNVHKALGTCESCGAYGELMSYDTTMYFVVFFVPLLPLGKKRIVNECPACRKHRVMSLKKWNQTKEKELTAIAAALQKSPNDPAVMREAIGTFVAFQDRSALVAAAAAAKRKFGQSAEVQMALGAAWMYFGNLEGAEEAYRAAVTASGGDDEREALAVCLIKQERPEEAAPLLTHVAAKKSHDGMGALYLLAMGYQTKGQHREALQTLDAIAKAFPREEKDREFKRLKKLSTKHAQSGKPVKSIELRRGGTVKEGRLSSPMLSRIIGPVVGLLIVGGYLYAAFAIGAAREIHVVNGLDERYEVEIAGKRVTVHPHVRATIEVPEGEIRVRVLDEALGIPEQTTTISTRFITRPLNDDVYVLNPDRVALLLWEQTVYYAGSHPLDNPKPPRVHVGKLLYKFEDIEYEFARFPPTASMEGNSELRERIDLLWDLEPEARLNAIVEYGREGVLPAYLKRMATYRPGVDFYLETLIRAIEPEKSIEFIRPMLERRPPLIEWHRTYQGLVQYCRDEHDLVAEYRQILSVAPDDAALTYLYARVVEDRDEALALFAKSANAPEPCAYGCYALASHALSRADFTRALAEARKATRLAPEREVFAEIRDDAMLGLKMYDELIEARRAEQKASPYLLAPVAEEAKLHCLDGKPEAADACIEAYCSRSKREFDEEVIAEYRTYLGSVKKYALGDVPGYAEALASVDEDEFALEILTATGELEDASEILSDEDYKHSDWHALLYLEAVAAGRDDLAWKHLDTYVEALGEGSSESRAIHAYLSGEKDLDVNEALRFLDRPHGKRTVMTMFGLRFGDHAESFFSLAEKLNYIPVYPRHVIEKVIEMRRVPKID